MTALRSAARGVASFMARGAASASMVAIAAIAAWTPACSRDTAHSDAPAGSASASAGANASAAPSASAAPASAGATKAYAGKYTSVAGSLYVPDGGEWSGTKWRGDESQDGIGEGTIALSVKGDRVEGTIDGPLGAAVVYGSITDGQLAADIVRKDATDHGFSGTMVGKVSGGSVDGDMRLSVASARLIRRATFSLKEK